MAWALTEGVVTDVVSMSKFRMRTDAGDPVEVSLANVAEGVAGADPVALKALINGKRVQVMSTMVTRSQATITGEVTGPSGIGVARELLRSGAVRFAPAEPYTISSYSECLHRIAEREAKAARLGIWREIETTND